MAEVKQSQVCLFLDAYCSCGSLAWPIFCLEDNILVYLSVSNFALYVVLSKLLLESKFLKLKVIVSSFLNF